MCDDHKTDDEEERMKRYDFVLKKEDGYARVEVKQHPEGEYVRWDEAEKAESELVRKNIRIEEWKVLGYKIEAERDRLREQVESAYIALGVHLQDDGPDLDAYIDGHVDGLALFINNLQAELAEEKESHRNNVGNLNLQVEDLEAERDRLLTERSKYPHIDKALEIEGKYVRLREVLEKIRHEALHGVSSPEQVLCEIEAVVDNALAGGGSDQESCRIYPNGDPRCANLKDCWVSPGDMDEVCVGVEKCPNGHSEQELFCPERPEGERCPGCGHNNGGWCDLHNDATLHLGGCANRQEKPEQETRSPGKKCGNCDWQVPRLGSLLDWCRNPDSPNYHHHVDDRGYCDCWEEQSEQEAGCRTCAHNYSGWCYIQRSTALNHGSCSRWKKQPDTEA